MLCHLLRYMVGLWGANGNKKIRHKQTVQRTASYKVIDVKESVG